jgi:CheY-like chemotaxis protein
LTKFLHLYAAESALRRRRKALLQEIEAANSRDRARAKFFLDKSHALRSPLHSILGYAQLLSRSSSKVSLDEGLATIAHAGHTLLKTIDDVLDTCRIDMGQLSLRPKQIRWSNFVGELSATALEYSLNGNVHSIMGVQGIPPAALFLDVHCMQKAIGNLLAFAKPQNRKFAISLGVEIAHHSKTVALELRIPCNDARISRATLAALETNGPNELLQLDFELYIAFQLIQMLGGKLELDDCTRNEICLVFSLSCPMLNLEDISSIDDLRVPVAYAGVRRTVLIAEDEIVNLGLLEDLLNDVGFDVITAMTGKQAIGKFSKDIDLIITDQLMPDGDGWHVLQAANEFFGQCPIILLTASHAAAPKDFPENVDFSSVLLKPVDFRELLIEVGDLLGLHWHYDDEIEKEEDSAEPSSIPYSPPPAVRNELARLLRHGLVTDIVDFGVDLKNKSSDPTEIAFADRIVDLANRIDFDALTEMIKAG